MPKFNSSAVGDWIQIGASVGVVAGILFLFAALFFTQASIEPVHSNKALERVSRELPGDSLAEVTKERQGQLQRFVAQSCSPCHGLTGGIGPTLSKVNLQHLSLNAVTFTILYGRPAKGMPPWESQISRLDAYWIAEFLKRGSGEIRP